MCERIVVTLALLGLSAGVCAAGGSTPPQKSPMEDPFAWIPVWEDQAVQADAAAWEAGCPCPQGNGPWERFCEGARMTFPPAEYDRLLFPMSSFREGLLHEADGEEAWGNIVRLADGNCAKPIRIPREGGSTSVRPEGWILVGRSHHELNFQSFYGGMDGYELEASEPGEVVSFPGNTREWIVGTGEAWLALRFRVAPDERAQPIRIPKGTDVLALVERNPGANVWMQCDFVQGKPVWAEALHDVEVPVAEHEGMTGRWRLYGGERAWLMGVQEGSLQNGRLRATMLAGDYGCLLETRSCWMQRSGASRPILHVALRGGTGVVAHLVPTPVFELGVCVSGMVRDESGAPVPGARVTLHEKGVLHLATDSDGDEGPYARTTGTDGKFQFGPFERGPVHFLDAQAPGLLPVEYVQIIEGTPTDIVLTRGAFIVPKWPDGKKPERASANVWRAADGEINGVQLGTGSGSGWSGDFGIGPLEAGNYVLDVDIPHFLPFHTTVDLPAGAHVEVPIPLELLPPVSIRLVNEAGEPLATAMATSAFMLGCDSGYGMASFGDGPWPVRADGEGVLVLPCAPLEEIGMLSVNVDGVAYDLCLPRVDPRKGAAWEVCIPMAGMLEVHVDGAVGGSARVSADPIWEFMEQMGAQGACTTVEVHAGRAFQGDDPGSSGLFRLAPDIYQISVEVNGVRRTFEGVRVESGKIVVLELAAPRTRRVIVVDRPESAVRKLIGAAPDGSFLPEFRGFDEPALAENEYEVTVSDATTHLEIMAEDPDDGSFSSMLELRLPVTLFGNGDRWNLPRGTLRLERPSGAASLTVERVDGSVLVEAILSGGVDGTMPEAVKALLALLPPGPCVVRWFGAGGRVIREEHREAVTVD